MEGTWQCAPSKIANIFAEGWKEIWNEPWDDPHGGFGPIPIEEIKRSTAINGRKLQAVALGIRPNKAEELDGWIIPGLRAILPEHWDELAAILRRC
eukprot:14332144-Heterocapsa_arctica.AAC.1